MGKKMIFLLLSFSFLFISCKKLEKKSNKNVPKTNLEERKEAMPPVKTYFDENILKEEEEFEGSLWSKKQKSIYKDGRASEIGDIVFVNISDSTKASMQESGSKSYSAKLEGGAAKKFEQGVGGLGKGTYNSSNQLDLSKGSAFDGRISARIEKIDKYGNLFIKGIKKVLVSNRMEKLEVSGFVRPQDISFENNINSDYMDKLEITYNDRVYYIRGEDFKLGENKDSIQAMNPEDNEGKETEIKKANKKRGLFGGF